MSTGKGTDGENGRTNPGCDDPLTADNYSHGGSQQTDWKKFADETMEDFLSRCPGGTYGGNEGGQDTEHCDTSLNDDEPNLNDTYSGTEDEESIEPQKPSENREQFLRYVFHLYLDEKVESVKILTERPMLNGCITMSLQCCSDDRKFWRSPELFVHANQQDTFRYCYVVKYKEGTLRWLYKKVTGDKDDKTLKERTSRKLNVGIRQYDIFHNPNDHNRMRNIFLGQMFFVQQLYYSLVNVADLKEMLLECEHVGFGHPGYAMADIDSFIQRVVEIINKNPSSYQCVYICSLLGQFVDRVRARSAWYTCDSLGKQAADQLLSGLGCYSTYKELPQSSIKFIKVVAEDLCKVGSSTGWLLFIKVFCTLFDVNYVMQVADTFSLQAYTEKQFDQLVPSVLDSLARLKDLVSCRRFCCYIIDHSPSVQCLWNLYHAISFRLSYRQVV